jgi:cytochrome c-type biogenesis protein CcmH/NrfG
MRVRKPGFILRATGNGKLAAFLSILLVTLAVSYDIDAQVKTVTSQMRSVVIKSVPNASVWIDGVLYGKTDDAGELRITSIASGSHSIRLRSDGFKETSRTLASAEKGDVKVSMAKTTDEAELAFQEAERLGAVDRDKSIEAYRRAVKLRPSYAEAYLALARALSDNGDLDEARSALASARRVKPSYAEASAVEGRVLKDGGNEEKAIAAFKRAITEGHGFQPEALTGLGLLYKERAEGFGGAGDLDQEKANYDESAKYLKQALKQLSGAPDAIVVYQLLGLIYEREKRFAEAIALYEDFLRLFPDSSEATAVRSFIDQIKIQMEPQK